MVQVTMPKYIFRASRAVSVTPNRLCNFIRPELNTYFWGKISEKKLHPLSNILLLSQTSLHLQHVKTGTFLGHLRTKSGYSLLNGSFPLACDKTASWLVSLSQCLFMAKCQKRMSCICGSTIMNMVKSENSQKEVNSFLHSEEHQILVSFLFQLLWLNTMKRPPVGLPFCDCIKCSDCIKEHFPK